MCVSLQFADVVLNDAGEIVADPGVPGTETELNEPCGLAPGMERYLPQDSSKTKAGLTSSL